jgi:sulfoxide reductase heme-binding subunit YedZ
MNIAAINLTPITPWRDRRGRFVAIKAAAFALMVAPGAVLAWRWTQGELGARALNAAIHGTGLWAIRFLLISLAVTPFRFVLDAPKLFIIRRMLGLAALAYAGAHLSLYVVDQGFDPIKVVTEIFSRLYLTIGFVALLGLTVLGITSADRLVKRLGARWKKLHRLVYPIAALGLLHHFMQAKADVSSAVLVTGFFAWLMMVRLLPFRWRRHPAALLGLTAIAAAATMGIEFAWYDIATKINAWRVLHANFAFGYGLRPAIWVALIGLGVAVVVAGQRALAWISPARRKPARKPAGTATQPG